MEGELSGEQRDGEHDSVLLQKEDVYYYEDYVKNINNKPFLHMDNLAKFSIQFKNILNLYQHARCQFLYFRNF